ncbi:hypothetical protein PFICI_10697 [Pestalotiopsis fici W106-1]|uniref:FAD-binding PCMH-type domain-containing protein n=1 Tax=Pestalotiopsis fici (strain W106-1 / CGMCC3.15140) TaxID=1229662 RepID=W3WXS0_PESFW|nr:uncharacterized protein PFICI_10697 [Pestalotiopsis fici W106-1]ETS78635.1 hypothetical protein PFICI_10697 [Pestalotiopsis fici W106-1]
MKIISIWVKAAAAAAVTEIVFARPEPPHSHKCCHALASNPALKGRVVYPNSTIYEDRIDSIWSLDAALTPWCIVLPTSTEETAAVIQIIDSVGCPFGIRSGGHGTFANSNNVNDGVTIDFGYMNSTTYDPKTNIASLQPGGRWGSVYKTLEPYGVAVAGGRQNPVGVAGFLLGGGNSYYNNAYGWGCDSVENFEVVLASGQVVNANAEENRDLWIALKGGTGNFGLVTRFDMRVIPYANTSDPVFWCGTLSWGKNVSDNVIEVLSEFADNVPNDPSSTTHALIVYTSDGTWSIVFPLINIDNKEWEPAFDGLKSVPYRLKSTMRHDTMWSIAQEASGPGGAHNFNIVCAVKNDPQLLKYIFARHEELVKRVNETIPPETVWYSLLQLQPITVPMVAAGQGLNSLGLENDIAASGGGPGIMSSITMQIDNPELEATMYALALECQKDIEQYARSLGNGLWEWRYLNYADLTYDPLASYGEESVKRLRQVSHQYDPEGVFQHLRKSGFKIPE